MWIWDLWMYPSGFKTLCSPSSTIGTAAHSPTSTFGTDNRAMQNDLNPIVLHLCTQWHCLELSINIHWIPIVGYSGELPALSLLLIFQLRYLWILKNNLAFTGSVQSEQRVKMAVCPPMSAAQPHVDICTVSSSSPPPPPRFHYFAYFSEYWCTCSKLTMSHIYTERQKKLITSSGRRSLKSTASKLIIFGHK